MENQLSIFDIMYPKYKIKKSIRLIEFFAGYGSQALALKYLGVKFEHWKICEWAIKSIQAYKNIHFTNEKVDLDLLMNKKQMVDFLYSKGISSNYNEPMSKEQISRLSEEQLETIMKNIFITHNLVNIQQVKGEDLEIVDTDKYDYILTYSFPCQDLSLAGKGKGMGDTSTRSGMLWEVERILNECYELGTLPQCLIMENVVQIHGEGNVEDFNKWQRKLEQLGYKNYFQDLTATDYEIPQTRNRCFMISLLGDYSYTFPKPLPLKLKLKDMLEDNVDDKYYLSDTMIKYVTKNGEVKPKEDFNVIDVYNKVLTDKNVSGCIVTGQGRNQGSMIMYKPQVIGGFGKIGSTGQFHQQNRVYDDKIAISVTTDLNPYYKSSLKIRKLTPKECFRLMGVKDEDYEKCAKNQSDSSLYHLAGDSIVVNVLMAIFKELIGDKDE